MPSDFLQKVRNKIQQIKPFKVSFTQQILYENEIEIEENGELTFKNEDLIKWVYQKPDYKIFILKQNEYQFYDHDYEQLTIGKVKEKKKEWIWRLLFAGDIESKIKYDKKNNKLIVRGIADELEVDIYIDKKYLPQKIVQKDPFGYTRITLFKSYKKRVKLRKDEFQLKVGKNVDVVIIE